MKSVNINSKKNKTKGRNKLSVVLNIVSIPLIEDAATLKDET